MIQNLPNEEWKPIKGFEDYEISNKGRVKSLKYGKERILKYGYRNGYKIVSLNKENTKQTFKIHRLVAEAFIPNNDPINKIFVNHIDENKENNDVSNLNWMTPSENTRWGNGIKKMLQTRKENAARMASLEAL